jgi:hypothetical protein
LSSAEDDAGVVDVATDDADSLDIPVPGYRAIRPCSIGLTFKVSVDSSLEIDLHETARYVPVQRATSAVADPKSDKEAPKAEKSEGPGARVEGSSEEPKKDFDAPDWARKPLGYRLAIDRQERRTEWRTNEYLGPNGASLKDSGIEIDVRRRPQSDGIVYTITLINKAPQPESPFFDVANLYQAGVKVRAVRPDGSPGILPRPVVQFADDEDALSNLLLYRNVREYAVGHGIAATWDPPDLGRYVMAAVRPCKEHEPGWT